MILAGGTGEELSALTMHRAKTAIPFGGRYRIIDFCLSNCVHSGINEIEILTQYSPKSLIDHIGMGKPWDLDRKSGGVYILQPTHHGEAAQWYLGTADALYHNIEIIRDSKVDLILVLSGDQVYMMDYRKMVKYHHEHGKPVTIALKEVHSSQKSRFGMVRCSPGGLVTAFREKPSSSPFRFASLGIYLFDKEFLLDILKPGTIDIVFDIIIPLLRDRKVAGFNFNGYWEDIGSITSYYRASLGLLKRRSLITNSEWPIFTRGADLSPTKFSERSNVTDSIIAEGCRIGGDVTGSILFPGVHVERGAVVENSVVFSFSHIGSGARVNKSIIDKIVAVGSGARIGIKPGKGEDSFPPIFDGSGMQNSSGITVIGKAAKISEGTYIPAGSIIEPQSKLSKRSKK